ncbi:MAG: hypothetical protein ACKPCM_18565 [Pseudanabaena sp.]
MNQNMAKVCNRLPICPIPLGCCSSTIHPPTSKGLFGQNIYPDRLATVIREEILTEQALAWLIEHSEIELVEQGSLKPPVDETLESIEPEVDADGVVTVDAASEEA